MNWYVFSDWCELKVFTSMKLIKKKSGLVLVRATYHIFLDEEYKRPATSWNKARLADSVARWEGIPEDWPSTWRVTKTKNELLERAREIYPKPTYKIQKISKNFIAGNFEVKILFLPVAHPEIYPIVIAWSKIKREIAYKNLAFRLSAVEEETK